MFSSRKKRGEIRRGLEYSDGDVLFPGGGLASGIIVEKNIVTRIRFPTMPTALAIEGSLQYRNKESLAKQPSPPTEELPASEVSRGTSMHRFFYSPALYATPEPAPIPDVSSILYSPNIYIVNHKRRDSRSRSAVPNRVEGFENQQVADVLNGGDVIPLSGFLGKEGEEKKFVGWVGDVEIVEELNDDFNDPRDCVNVGTSESDVEDGDYLERGRLGNQLPVQFRSQDEYYDTAEEYFSDASLSKSSPSLRRSSENELRLLKLCLIEESSKRKAAEENLLHLNKQHEDLLKCLHRSRSFSPDLLNLRNEIDPTEIWQQLVVLRSVFEALETDLAKAEVEEASAEIIVAKNHEISRLRDRMMYYEAMNREMSQRNLEAVDLARKRRLRRRRMRRWIWSCVGLSVTAGASLLAYSYLPPCNGSEIPSTSDPSSAGITE